MNCLCCGKPVTHPHTSDGWHLSCIRRFFGTKVVPHLQLNDEVIMSLAEKSVARGFTVPGVQKKLSLHLSREGNARLTLVDYPTGYILKPQVQEFTALPESEHLVMLMAEAGGLSVVPHALIRIGQQYAYITKRVDRDMSVDPPGLFAMEDFCQLSLRLTQDKYKGSYEQCTKVIRQYSCRPGLDLSELFLRLVFSFLTGNSDMHLKNFSLMETAPKSREFSLSPAYDLLPVNVIMPEDREELALQLDGKKSNLKKKNFLSFADHTGLPRSAAEAMIRSMLQKLPRWKQLCEDSFLPPEMKTALWDLIRYRSARLS